MDRTPVPNAEQKAGGNTLLGHPRAPEIDRIACPWLIRRFIDPEAEFIYVPTERVFAVARVRI
jgi:hypothetical protein